MMMRAHYHLHSQIKCKCNFDTALCNEDTLYRIPASSRFHADKYKIDVPVLITDLMVSLANQARIYWYYRKEWPIPVVERSKAWVCGRLPAEIEGSNPTGGMDVCCECCVLSGRGLCDGPIPRTEESYRL
jgi:hypothetical protein